MGSPERRQEQVPISWAAVSGGGSRRLGDPKSTGRVWVPPTFGAREEQLVRGVHAEHGLGVALGHGDALQRGRPGALGSSDRGDDAPSRERGREAPVSPGPRPGRARLRGSGHTQGLRGPRHRPWGPRATKARARGAASQSPSLTLPGSQTSQAQPGVRRDGPCLRGVPSDPA